MTNNDKNWMEKARTKALEATKEDKSQNFDFAAELYIQACDQLLIGLQNGNLNTGTRNQLKTQFNAYANRAEELKENSKSMSMRPSSTKSPTSSTSPRTSHSSPSSKSSKSPKSSTPSSPTDSPEELDDPEFAKFKEKFNGSIVKNPNISFEDVVGLMGAKQALREAVILPARFPQLFQGKRKPWAGILLYGPPGTGKSYLAKAIATECQQTFISISSSDLLSKWLGESEKSVKYLFAAARQYQPCIVFIDEIDSLCSERSDTESESSRRVKTEFLVQMQGVGTNNTGVLVLAATNIPWGLDSAIRRRFEKRIYIPLPGVGERAAMFKTHLGVNTYHSIKENEWIILGERSENYSGSDIAAVCREALLRPIRRMSAATHFKKIENPKGTEPRYVWVNCLSSDSNAVQMKLDSIEPSLITEPPVTFNDMLAALQTQKPSVGLKDLKMHEKFTETFGQEGS